MSAIGGSAKKYSFSLFPGVNLPIMDDILDLLSADQLDAIIATYGTVSNWLAQVGDYLSEALNSIITDDIMF